MINLSDLSRNVKLLTILTAITVFFHFIGAIGNLGKSIDLFDLDLGLLFIINAIGFIVFLLLGYYLELNANLNKLSRYLLPIWTIGTIIGWVLYHHVSVDGTFLELQTYLDPSLITKIVEVLILLFWFLDYQETRNKTYIIFF